MPHLISHPRLPIWVSRAPGSARETHQLKQLLRRAKLNSVCEEARCPNIAECFSRSTATFMILGDICTRGCRFCSITTGKPLMQPSEFAAEGERIADAAEALNLKHVVVTSVTRDDLADGGAAGFVGTIRALRGRVPGVTVEVLVPDFQRAPGALERVIEAAPDVFNHNLETVHRLYPRVRPGASYRHSLALLKRAKELSSDIVTKTGIMLGFGEARDEVRELMEDARAAEVDFFTAGQYLRPTKHHLPVEAYISEESFRDYTALAHAAGFKYAAIGPLVRSSYHAAEGIEQLRQSV